MSDFELTISICSWNTASDLRACLESLQSVRTEAPFEVIVVDNASTDGSPDMVDREFPWVRLLRQSRNLGFSAGHNLAMRHRLGKHVFLLNSDTTVHPGAIRTLLNQVALRADAGILGPKILNPDGTLQLSCRRFPSLIAPLFRNTILGRLFPRNRYVREYLMQDYDHSSPQEVDWLSGAALLATEPFIERVGGLDESYFMYCEEMDWCWRAHAAGFSVWYIPQATVTHAIGRSTDQMVNRMIWQHRTSMLLFFRKHMLSRYPAGLRRLLYWLAVVGLSARALAYILKNWFDASLRWLKRR